MRRLLGKSLGLVNYVTKMATGCCKSNKSCYNFSIKLKGVLVKYVKYGTLFLCIIKTTNLKAVKNDFFAEVVTRSSTSR